VTDELLAIGVVNVNKCIIRAVSRGDDPIVIDDAAAAKMMVVELNAALPRPGVRLRFFASDNAHFLWTNSTLHGYNHHSNAVSLNRRNGRALNLYLFNVQPHEIVYVWLGVKWNFKKHNILFAGIICRQGVSSDHIGFNPNSLLNTF